MAYNWRIDKTIATETFLRIDVMDEKYDLYGNGFEENASQFTVNFEIWAGKYYEPDFTTSTQPTKLTIECINPFGDVYHTYETTYTGKFLMGHAGITDYDDWTHHFGVMTLANKITLPRWVDGSIILKVTVNSTLKGNFGGAPSVYINTASVELTIDDIVPYQRTATILTADNFNDEGNPVITYKDPTRSDAKIYACISVTGAEDDVPYREIPKGNNSYTGTYTFNLTEDERNTLRIAAIDTQTLPVRFYIKTIYESYEGYAAFDYVTRTFTVVNCNPIINQPTIKEVQSTVLALTGDEDTVVLNESMIEYSYEPVVKKQATIANQFVQCGTQKASGLSQGVIDDVESGTFLFSVTDSRGLTTTTTVTKNVIEYVKPTCYQELAIEITGETGATIGLTIRGNYYNGSFGLVDNTLKLEVRHTQNDGTMGDWVDLTDGLIPVFDTEKKTYELHVSISGFTYSMAYEFQCRATDKLNTVISSMYKVKMMPVFDWGENDFNFNVPINIEGETIGLHGETVIRHGKDTNNTVLSGSGGHIYLRPGGTTDTSSEVRITSQGNVEIKGDIILNGTSLLTILENAGLI